MKHHETVRRLMHQGKGILAADETPGTIGKRFEALGVENSEDTRRAFRELLLRAPGVEHYLSGVILQDETIRQQMSDGTPFPEFLQIKNMCVGIKVDQGRHLDPQFNGEVTTGLDGLRARLKEYKGLGADFTKWRATYTVGSAPGMPSEREDASRMAAYALDALEEGLVPIIEPEVLMAGTHSAADAESSLIEALSVTIDALHARDIDLRSVILKTSMAVSGSLSETRAGPTEVAERTVRALTASVPDEMGGVVFLSGGQTPQEATMNLNAIARTEPLPWPVTFSFSRALQSEPMKLWAGSSDHDAEVHSAFLERLSLVVSADAAAYTKNQEETSL